MSIQQELEVVTACLSEVETKLQVIHVGILVACERIKTLTNSVDL